MRGRSKITEELLALSARRPRRPSRYGRSTITGGLLATILLSITALAQGTGGIKGKVRVEVGSPSGVVITAYQGEREVARAKTNDKGEFVITGLQPGRYSLSFRKPGLSVGRIDDVEVRAGKIRQLGDRLIMTVDEGSLALIRGSVFTAEGRSFPGVRVELARIEPDGSLRKLDGRITNETGSFGFRLPPDPARYRITAKADGMETASKDIEVDGAAVYRLALQLRRKQ